MFALFLREYKKVIFSVPFLILLAGMLLMVISQDVLDFSEKKIEMPQPEQNYGMQSKEISEIIMPAATASLYSEFKFNSYTAYPIGFYKNVKLNDKEQQQMAEILSKLTGISADELMKSSSEQMQNDNSLTFENGNELNESNGEVSMNFPDTNIGSKQLLSVKDELTYEEFKAFMQQADKLIGGGSDYSEASLLSFGKVPITYEEAVESYHLLKAKDEFTGAYARLFTDYLVNVMSVLPVFIAVAISLKDRRFRMHELIYTRKSSSINIVLTRYCAIITTIMIPVVIIS